MIDTNKIVNNIIGKEGTKGQSVRRRLKQNKDYKSIRNKMKYFAVKKVGVDVIDSNVFDDSARIDLVKDVYNYSKEPYNYLTTNEEQLQKIKDEFKERFGNVSIREGRYIDIKRDPRGYFPLVGYEVMVE